MSRVPRPAPPSSPAPEDDEEVNEEDMDQFDEDDEMMVDPMEMLGSFLATEDGETIATALIGLKDSTEKIALGLEMQNKILVKILSAISKPTSCCCKSAPDTA